MYKYLLPLSLGCTEIPDKCVPQFEEAENVCKDASVIGTNENAELYKAIDNLRECLGSNVKIICSDPGPFTENILIVE